jgi:energy-coupling factor transporter transmembrane protein EcfT
VRRTDPSTSLVFGLAAALAGAAGVWSALAALVGIAAWAAWTRVPMRALGWRLVPVVTGFAGFAIAAPFAPRVTAEVVLRGFATSAALVAVSTAVPWTRAVGVVQALHAPRALVAFLAILARHLVTLRDEAVQLQRTMLVRGAFGPGGRVRGVKVLLARLLPVALARADRVADALALRGFEGRLPQGTPWRPGRPDLAVGALSLLVAGAALAEVLR